MVTYDVKVFLENVAIGNTTTTMSSNGSNVTNSDQAQFVGPYKLEKTLGKGQTGKISVVVLFVVIFGFCE